MSDRKPKEFLTQLLKAHDIEVNGSRPWDPQIHDERFFGRIMTQGTLGLGEAYMDGWWDVEALDELIYRALMARIKDNFPIDLSLLFSALKGKLLNLQRLKVTEVGEKHYDIGNDLYSKMLDSRMIYSCGYWREADHLEAAQEAKLDLICRKLGLEPGMHILDIGSGWGGFLKFAAERYGVSGLGVTISREQAAYAEAHREGLPIETRLLDYMALEGQFDRIVSIGMFEHVGYKNYRAYFEKARSLLKPDGLFLLHTIGGNHSTTHGDPWSEKYIFPNGMLPSPVQITSGFEHLFVLEDWHNFGIDYDKTLMAWCRNFEAAWPELREAYGERFYRMWRYYLMSFAGTFRARYVQLWQLVLSPDGLKGGYASIR